MALTQAQQLALLSGGPQSIGLSPTNPDVVAFENANGVSYANATPSNPARVGTYTMTPTSTAIPLPTPAPTPAPSTSSQVASATNNISLGATTIAGGAVATSNVAQNNTANQIQSMRGPTVDDSGASPVFGATPPETLAYAPPSIPGETVISPTKDTATSGVYAVVPYTSAAVSAAENTIYPAGAPGTLTFAPTTSSAVASASSNTSSATATSSGGTALSSATPSSGGTATGQDATTTANNTTASSPSANDLLNSLISAIAAGGTSGAPNTGYGVGANDTSLPAPSAADVAALQPTGATTTSSGPSIAIVLGVLAVLGLGGYLYYRYRKEHNDG